MSQQTPSDKYLHFTVGLLKDSFALEALWKDALKHHMTDQPGQLIALRLTEYYEMMNHGIVQPVVRVPAIVTPVPPAEVEGRANKGKPAPPAVPAPPTSIPHTQPPVKAPMSNHSAYVNQVTGRMRVIPRDTEGVVSASPAADQNADEAADYWSTL